MIAQRRGMGPALALALWMGLGGAGEVVFGQVQAKAQAKPKPVKKIDVNAATPAQLAAVKGLTKDWADKIFVLKPFRSLDELAKVGMNKVQIDAVRPFLKIGSLGGPRKGRWRKPAYRLAPGEKVNLNTAERKVLEALPGIGVARAIAIIEHRPFGRIEDLMKIKGIKNVTFARLRGLVVVR